MCAVHVQVGAADVSVDNIGNVLEVVSRDAQGLPNQIKVVNYSVLERSFRDDDTWKVCKI